MRREEDGPGVMSPVTTSSTPWTTGPSMPSTGPGAAIPSMASTPRWALAVTRREAGRHSTWTIACSLAPSSAAAPSTARSGSRSWPIAIGSHGTRRRRSSRPAHEPPAITTSFASTGTAVAPGHAAATARARWLSSARGTTSRNRTRSSAMWVSKATCGEAASNRLPEESRPWAFDQNAAAPARSTAGGGRISR